MAARRRKARPAREARQGRIAEKARQGRAKRRRADPGVRRARLWLLGAVVLAAAIMVAWFPGSSLLNQRSTLADTEAQLSSLHKQDAALAQEQKSLSDAGEIGRIARSQYQLVSPGQQSYEVLPPSSGAASSGTPYSGDPGSRGPLAPTAATELPPGGAPTTTTTPPTTQTRAPSSAHGAKTASQPGSGMLARMLRALEFWR